MSVSIFTDSFILIALALLGRALWTATHGAEMRIIFRRGGDITVITVVDVSEATYRQIAALAGVNPEELDVRHGWVSRLSALFRSRS